MNNISSSNKASSTQRNTATSSSNNDTENSTASKLTSSTTVVDRIKNTPTKLQSLLNDRNEPSDSADNKFRASANPASDDGVVDLQKKADTLNVTIGALGTSGGYVTQTLQADLSTTDVQLGALQRTGSVGDRGKDGENSTVQSSGGPGVSVDGTNYQIGDQPPPDIHHDNGFLQNPDDPSDPVPIDTRPPTQEEKDYYRNQQILAEGGNIVSGIPGAGIFVERANLDEGIDAYRHFLNGDGETYTVDYDKYLNKDEHGRTTRDSIVEDVRSAGDQLFANEVANGEIDLDALEPGDSVTFTVSGDPIAVNENVDTNPDARYPYPESENWQKAIGAHHIYSTSEVTVTRQEDGTLLASADITVDFEDRYNFNPGQADIATQVPDSERGVLEESGLAQQFDQVGQAELSTQWIIGSPQSTYEAPSNGWFR